MELRGLISRVGQCSTPGTFLLSIKNIAMQKRTKDRHLDIPAESQP